MTEEISKSLALTPHFRGAMSPYVIIHHDKKIIEKIGTKLSQLEEIENHKYQMYRGNLYDRTITLIHTGMGAGNTALVCDQVISQGARYIFKLGTFGALQEHIQIGDIYVPMGAVRSDGLTDAYAPMEYPAIPTPEMFLAIFQAAQKMELPLSSGIVHSVNIYTPYYQKTYNPNKYSPEVYQELNVFGVEMECSSTFVCSYVKKAHSIAILLCNREWNTQKNFIEGKKVNWDKHKKDSCFEAKLSQAIELILQTVTELPAKG